MKSLRRKCRPRTQHGALEPQYLFRGQEEEDKQARPQEEGPVKHTENQKRWRDVKSK